MSLRGEHIFKCRVVFARLVLSVGGGNVEHNVSTNLVAAVHAKSKSAATLGLLGRDGVHAEAFQAVWHLLVSHLEIKLVPTKWESTGK